MSIQKDFLDLKAAANNAYKTGKYNTDLLKKLEEFYQNCSGHPIIKKKTFELMLQTLHFLPDNVPFDGPDMSFTMLTCWLPADMACESEKE